MIGAVVGYMQRVWRSWLADDPFVLSAQVQANDRHLYWDSFGFGILSGSTISFVAIYAVRVGASAL